MSVPISDKVRNLRQYIEDHSEDSDGNWEYEHLPYLTKEVSGLSQKDDNCLDAYIWDWPEAIRFPLADAVLHSSFTANRRHYYYIRIFLHGKNPENIAYLAENLPACFPETTLHLWPDSFIRGCLKKIGEVNDYLNARGESSTYEFLLKKLADELFARGFTDER